MTEGKHIEGDLSVSRHVTAGGNATVRGCARVEHNLRVEGWLEAPNIKGANKGVFGSADQLHQSYPTPEDGWFAIVGGSLPGRIYYGFKGKWVDSGRDGGDVTADDHYLHEYVERLSAELTAERERNDVQDQDISSLESRADDTDEAMVALSRKLESTTRLADDADLALRDEIRPALETVVADMRTVKPKVSALEGELEDFRTGDFADLQSDVGVLGADVLALQAKTKSLSASSDRQDLELDDCRHDTELLGKRVDALETGVARMDETIIPGLREDIAWHGRELERAFAGIDGAQSDADGAKATADKALRQAADALAAAGKSSEEARQALINSEQAKSVSEGAKTVVLEAKDTADLACMVADEALGHAEAARNIAYDWGVVAADMIKQSVTTRSVAEAAQASAAEAVEYARQALTVAGEGGDGGVCGEIDVHALGYTDSLSGLAAARELIPSELRRGGLRLLFRHQLPGGTDAEWVSYMFTRPTYEEAAWNDDRAWARVLCAQAVDEELSAQEAAALAEEAFAGQAAGFRL